MFLANSLKEKIKKNYLEGEYEPITTTESQQYIPKEKDPRVLFSFKDSYKSDPILSSSCNLNSQQLRALDKNEWENAFTVKKLHLKWDGKTDLDFEQNFKKFNDNAMYPRSIEARQYIRKFRDPDILELNKKNWNSSNSTREKFRPELKKTLFEVRNGLMDFQIVPLKEKKVNEGVDTRDHLKIDGKIWNTSRLINKKQFKLEGIDNLTLAQENTKRYWKENEENRDEEKPFPIDEDRKKFEIIRYFKKYRSPCQKTIDFYNTMDKVKELTFIEKENAEKKVKHNNPGLLPRYPEKLNALVFKELTGTYKDKYNELTGRLSKEELRKKQIRQNKFKWSDVDLANKITAINKLNNSGILDLNIDKNSSTIKLSKSQNKERKNILLPLVVKGTEIELEEQKIKEKLEEDYKKQKKLEMLMELKSFKRKRTKNKFISKYPLTKSEYDFNKLMEKKSSMDFSNENENKLDRKIEYLTSTTSSIDLENTNSILKEISKDSNCHPHFLEAYSIVAGKELEKINSQEKKNKGKIKYEYSHPGKFREFIFVEKVKKPKPENKPKEGSKKKKEDIDEYEEIKVKNQFWSCCMNADPNSPGCQKKLIKNFQYLYD